MNEVILDMLRKYDCQSQEDYQRALKEIIQEVALLGLWRAKFFEHALFYGGTALRILYQLDRFSEDLDFSLLQSDSSFDVSPYLKAIEAELESFGFKSSVQRILKKKDSQVESAFIKAGTKIHFISADLPQEIIGRVQTDAKMKIKFEVDTDPPGGFVAEVKTLLLPIPFFVKTMRREDLFAGKLHAVLARQWKNRVKGRDWYDLVWYIAREVNCNLIHLRERLVQSGHWKAGDRFEANHCLKLLKEKVQGLDVQQAKADIQPFLTQRSLDSLGVWSRDFFLDLTSRIKFIES